MANPALLDIDMSAVDFAAAHAELLTLKLDNPRTRPDADSKLRAIAAWANYVDDCALAFQARLYEHATAITDLTAAVEALEADPGVTDHGDLTGLGDNDHPQYLLVASHAARSIVGRAANSSGNAADIAGAGAGTLAHDNGTTIAFRSLIEVETIYDIDFSTLADNTIVDGAEVIDSLTWTAVNAAELGTFAIQNGTGLRMVAATGNGGATTMTSTSQLIPYIWLPLSSIPNYDPRRDLIVEIYCSSLVHEASGEGVVVGLHGPTASPTGGSVSRMRWAGLVNDGANDRALRVTLTTTATTTDDNREADDVVGFKLNHVGLGSAWSGVYSSGFPRAVSVGPAFGTASATENPFNSNGVRLFIGLICANDASPTTAATVRRLRISQ